MQGNGILNAFAAKVFGRNYVILNSDILATAFKEGMPAVSFVIGHELGHHKRNHLSFFKTFGLLPARMIPFLGSAYSRACEYTCDAIGQALSPEGAEKGILILTVGNELYTRVNIHEMLKNAQEDQGFVVSFVELFASHPRLVKRLETIHRVTHSNQVQASFKDTREASKLEHTEQVVTGQSKEDHDQPNA